MGMGNEFSLVQVCIYDNKLSKIENGCIVDASKLCDLPMVQTCKAIMVKKTLFVGGVKYFQIIFYESIRINTQQGVGKII